MDAGSFAGWGGGALAFAAPVAGATIPETIGTQSAAGAQNLIAVLALSLSIAAIIISGIFARRANRISASEPWVALLIQRIAAEIEMTMQDRDLVRQLCWNAYPTAERKHEVRDNLEKLRQTSARQMHALIALCPMATTARDRRSTVDAIDDSYFDNEDTSMDEEKAGALLKRYETEWLAYLAELRDLVGKVCSRKFHPWVAATKRRWWHFWSG